MKKISRMILLSAIAGVMVLSGLILYSNPSSATQPITRKTEALDVPILTLKHWQESTTNEKMSFLYGFITMVVLEREWQGDRVLPIKQSIISSWVKGLEGRTISELCKTVDAYAVQHPNQLDQPVLMVLGLHYVRPKMNDAERKAASARWEEIKE